MFLFLVVEVLLVAVAVSPRLVDRKELARAVYDYSQEQSEPNRRILEHEHSIADGIRKRDSIVVWVLLAAYSWGLILLYRRWFSTRGNA